ncbi:unnamed protein product, partial [Rotaria magnacalcarata]
MIRRANLPNVPEVLVVHLPYTEIRFLDINKKQKKKRRNEVQVKPDKSDTCSSVSTQTKTPSILNPNEVVGDGTKTSATTQTDPKQEIVGDGTKTSATTQTGPIQAKIEAEPEIVDSKPLFDHTMPFSE